jgi:general stress protein 26
MKMQTQNTPELQRLADLIETLPVAMLTTLDGDGALVSRPMSPLEMDADGALWFFTDIRSSKVEQIDTLNLSFADRDRGTYVSISGHGEVFANHTRAAELWTAMAKPWFPDGPESPNLALLKVVADAADYWDAPHGKMVRVLAMAVSIVTGEPIATGEHGSFSNLS